MRVLNPLFLLCFFPVVNLRVVFFRLKATAKKSPPSVDKANYCEIGNILRYKAPKPSKSALIMASGILYHPEIFVPLNSKSTPNFSISQ